MGFEKDIFGEPILPRKPIEVNIYADEAMDRKCPYSGQNWHYICLIVERIDKPLLEDIIKERYCYNFDKESPYYQRNNKILHWTDMSSANEKNICKRWFEYIVDKRESHENFFCYILGLNESFLNDEEFDKENKFNSIYNRFFRSAISYALKCFFSDQQIIIKKIYHEQGQQQHHKYFSWHPIDKLEREEENFEFDTNEIEFLGKDHTQCEKANILQLCDCFLGAVVNIIHDFENRNSSRTKLKQELVKIILPLIERMIKEPNNKNSSYKHANRIMIRFFPKEKTQINDLRRYSNQFYTILPPIP